MQYIKKASRIASGVLLFLLISFLQICQDLWYKAQTSVRHCSGMISNIYAEIKEQYKEFFYTPDEALKAVLPSAKEFKEETKTLTEEQKKIIEKSANVKFNADYDKEFHWYKGTADEKVVGYACIDIVPGKWGPVKFMMGVSPDGKVTDIAVMALSERRGRPVKERKFLDQYIGKSISEPLKMKKDIRGIAGATITSRGVTEGIRKVLYVFNEVYKK